MDALVIWQPWATLVMLGLKPHEFRAWDFTAPKKIGPRMVKGRTDLVGRRIVICAGARPIKPAEVLFLINRIEVGEAAVSREAIPLLRRLYDAHKCQGVLELGVGLGTVVLGQPKSVAQLYTGTKFFDSDRLNHHLFGWPMINPKPFPAPIPVKGLQGFFTFPAAVPEQCK